MYRITLLDWSEKYKRFPGLSRTRSMIVCPMFDKFARTILFLPSMSARSICGLLPTEEKYMYLEKVRHVNVSALNTILLNLIQSYAAINKDGLPFTLANQSVTVWVNGKQKP